MLQMQLTADGPNSVNGQNALLLVEEEPRPDTEPAQILTLLTVELTVRDKEWRIKIAIPSSVRVINLFMVEDSYIRCL